MKRALLKSALMILLLVVTSCSNSTDTLLPIGEETAKFIRNGTLVASGQQTQTVVLRFVESPGAFSCTGSFITNRFILTAAHCVTRPNGSVFSAANTSYSKNLAPPHSYTTSLNVIRHPDYVELNSTPGSYGQYDVALIEVNPDDNVGILPFYRVGQLSLSSGSAITIVGYGLDGAGGGEGNSGTKRTAELSHVRFTDNSSGQTNLGGLFLEMNQNSTLDQNACPGDSGGPAIREVNENASGNQKYILGVASFVSFTQTGQPCHSGVKSYYHGTHMSAVYNWVETTLTNANDLAPGGCAVQGTGYTTGFSGCRYQSGSNRIDFSSVAPVQMSYAKALDYCKALVEHTFGDWRLPTSTEVAVPGSSVLDHINFSRKARYWTSDTPTTNGAVAYNFLDGETNSLRPDELNSVICIR